MVGVACRRASPGSVALWNMASKLVRRVRGALAPLGRCSDAAREPSAQRPCAARVSRTASAALWCADWGAPLGGAARGPLLGGPRSGPPLDASEARNIRGRSMLLGQRSWGASRAPLGRCSFAAWARKASRGDVATKKAVVRARGRWMHGRASLGVGGLFRRDEE